MKLSSKKILPQKFSLPKSLLNINYNLNPILHNRIILYFISILALFDMFYFLNSNDVLSFAILILVGFLTSFFSKNMIVILVIALCVTHILKYGTSSYVSEGFENDNIDDLDLDLDSDSKNMDSKNMDSKKMDSKNMDSKNMDSEKMDSENMDSKKMDSKKMDSKKMDSKKMDSKKIDEGFNGKEKIEYSELKKQYSEFEDIQNKIVKNLTDIEPALQKAEEFIKKFESYKEGMGKK